jgi:hypothetical protein
MTSKENQDTITMTDAIVVLQFLESFNDGIPSSTLIGEKLEDMRRDLQGCQIIANGLRIEDSTQEWFGGLIFINPNDESEDRWGFAPSFAIQKEQNEY